MQWTADSRESKQQTTRGVLVIRIVLNDSGMDSRLPDFGLADVSLNDPFEGMMAELKLTGGELSANVIKRVHREWVARL